ncbi:DUF4037 domain-containing protein [Planctomonas psychrotolerans]|uniref:DUF4037 domain-containing protein n=1 Tax=Planctomonas psychrotolerans TaxID=2528712 RepID=UPI00123A19F5|nr:DUF4037 domain-containing protein [Planctomonas psychrotolerans]
MFEPAQSLCRRFHHEALKPVIGVPHSAGLLGPGSDVLGYDTERSTDHDWGPRAVVFVAEEHVDATALRIAAALPDSFAGWPVRMGRDDMPLEPHVEVTTLPEWLRAQFGREVESPPSTLDWLTMPQQRLLGVTAGAVFADDTGELGRVRASLAWYPDHVWWWLVACAWRRLDQEQPFVSRTAEVGDDLGSAVVASRQVRDCMRLSLLLARRYAPYSKWVGTAFARVHDPEGLGTRLRAVPGAAGAERERLLGEAYRILARRFNALFPGDPVDDGLRPFHDRPALVLAAERFAEAAVSEIRGSALRAMPLVGAIDQLVDSTDVLAFPERAAAFRPFYAGLLGRPSASG